MPSYIEGKPNNTVSVSVSPQAGRQAADRQPAGWGDVTQRNRSGQCYSVLPTCITGAVVKPAAQKLFVEQLELESGINC